MITINTEKVCKTFKSYKTAFNYYMKIRDDAEWLYVFDETKQQYLICENCNCR